MKLQKLSYPWVSIFLAILLVSYGVIIANPEYIEFYQLPSNYFNLEIQFILLIAFFGVVLTDIKIFNAKNNEYQAQLLSLNTKVSELLLAKKNLQLKAHTYSGHADKLKLFISDRLLEYIEYDEKFLHFKSIAAEVRHTGVICFDKVQTALNQAIEKKPEKNNDHYQDALHSIQYLWDLLELSTTDNLALHISNYLCECEEHYYQDILQDESLSSELSPPTFSAQSATIKALNKYLEKPLKQEAENESNRHNLVKNDTNFRINLDSGHQLLGNENHIVLLLENLINNAVFFGSKKPFKHKYARTSVSLQSQPGKACFNIFNHGPHISKEVESQLFKLGYSTRNAKAYNGKGLGLYFVNEIVKGYEGNISFKNISNEEETFFIRIKYSDDSINTETVITQLVGNKLKCKRDAEESLSAKTEWNSKKKVSSVEISMHGQKQPFTFTPEDKQTYFFLDPVNQLIPRWAIELVQKPRSSKIAFIPLDVNGVCFNIEIPSAESRLDHSDSTDNHIDIDEPDLSSLEEDFIPPERRIA